MTENRHLIVTRLHLLGGEETTHERLNPEERQHIEGSFNAVNGLRMVAFGDVVARPAIVSNLLKDIFLPGYIDDVRRRHAGLHISLSLLVSPLAQADQFPGAGVRQRAPYGLASQTEDSGICANAHPPPET